MADVAVFILVVSHKTVNYISSIKSKFHFVSYIMHWILNDDQKNYLFLQLYNTSTTFNGLPQITELMFYNFQLIRSFYILELLKFISDSKHR